MTEAHLAYQTEFTRTGKRSLKNKKPYRTKVQKDVARQTAKKVDGRWKSSAPVSYHK